MKTIEIQETQQIAPSTYEAVHLARQEAARMQAPEVLPEHLFLGILAQGDDRVAKVLSSLGMSMQLIRARVAEIFSGYGNARTDGRDLPLSKDAQECMDWALLFATQMHSSQVYPEHLLLANLRHQRLQPLLELLAPTEWTPPAHMTEKTGPAYTITMDQLIRSRVRDQSVVSFDTGRPRRILRYCDRPTTTFADILGMTSAKHELRKVVEFLKQPWMYQQSRRKYLYGVLLVGHPSTERTLLVHATAGEAVVPLISLSVSTLVDMLTEINTGAIRIEDLELPEREYDLIASSEAAQRGRNMLRYIFEQARDVSPCILFIDDIDAIDRLTTPQERQPWINQLLVEMDGLDPHPPMAVMATTSRLDTVEQALVHSGRFDRRIAVSGSFMARPAAQTKLCLSCKHEVLSSWKYCVHCSALLVKRCPTCGTSHVEVEGARYCYECGSVWASI